MLNTTLNSDGDNDPDCKVKKSGLITRFIKASILDVARMRFIAS